jgi:hypothetical protein
MAQAVLLDLSGYVYSNSNSTSPKKKTMDATPAPHFHYSNCHVIAHLFEILGTL